jgi:hypothetical protein
VDWIPSLEFKVWSLDWGDVPENAERSRCRPFRLMISGLQKHAGNSKIILLVKNDRPFTTMRNHAG